jgi:hypothetical protein
LASNRERRDGITALGVLVLVAYVSAAARFALLNNEQANPLADRLIERDARYRFPVKLPHHQRLLNQ